MKRFFISAIVTMSCFMANAQTISIPAVNLALGGEKTVSVSLEGATDYTAFQFDIALPTGVTVKSVGMDNKPDTRKIETGTVGDKFRVLSYDEGNAKFTSGSVLSLTFKAADDAAAEENEADVTTIVVVKDDGTGPSEATGTVAINVLNAVPVTISSFGKKTFSSNKDLDFSTYGDKLKAYVATGYEPSSSADGMGGTIWMTRVKDVPAGVGVFLKGDPGDYNVPVAASSSYYKNMLKGTGTSGVDILSSTDTYVNLYLTKNDAGDALIFRTIAGDGRTMSANGAYLQIPKPFTERPTAASGETETITISAEQGKGTYCSPENDLDFTSMGDNLKAYVATGYTNADGTIWMTRVKDVPAKTGIFLKGAKGSYNVPTKAKSADSQFSSVYENMMVGTVASTPIAQTTEDMTNYFLGLEEGVMKFYKVAADGRTMSAKRAYLQIPTSALSKSRGEGANEISMEAQASYDYGFVDDVIGVPVELVVGEYTGINTIGRTLDDNGAWYNLNGQRIDTPTKKGLYIHNGRKVVVK